MWNNPIKYSDPLGDTPFQWADAFFFGAASAVVAAGGIAAYEAITGKDVSDAQTATIVTGAFATGFFLGGGMTPPTGVFSTIPAGSTLSTPSYTNQYSPYTVSSTSVSNYSYLADQDIKAIHFVFESETPEIYQHTLNAISLEYPVILHYMKGNKKQKRKNRTNATKGFPKGDPSPDEYPYACTYESQCYTSLIAMVPKKEQSLQGARISKLYLQLNDNEAFLVVPIPKDNELEDVMMVLERLNMSLSNSTVTEMKQVKLQSEAIIKVIPRAINKAAFRLPFFFYDGPGGLNYEN